MIHKLDIKTTIIPNGDILQETARHFNGVRQDFIREVVHVQEEEIKNKLIQLGWTPPPPIDKQTNQPMHPVSGADDYTYKPELNKEDIETLIDIAVWHQERGHMGFALRLATIKCKIESLIIGKPHE